MEGIEKITAKIAQDAQAEISQLMAETDQKVQAVRANAAAQARQEANDIVEKGRAAASERLERLSSASQMERRKLESCAPCRSRSTSPCSPGWPWRPAPPARSRSSSPRRTAIPWASRWSWPPTTPW